MAGAAEFNELQQSFILVKNFLDTYNERHLNNLLLWKNILDAGEDPVPSIQEEFNGLQTASSILGRIIQILGPTIAVKAEVLPLAVKVDIYLEELQKVYLAIQNFYAARLQTNQNERNRRATELLEKLMSAPGKMNESNSGSAYAPNATPRVSEQAAKKAAAAAANNAARNEAVRRSGEEAAAAKAAKAAKREAEARAAAERAAAEERARAERERARAAPPPPPPPPPPATNNSAKRDQCIRDFTRMGLLKLENGNVKVPEEISTKEYGKKVLQLRRASDEAAIDEAAIDEAAIARLGECKDLIENQAWQENTSWSPNGGPSSGGSKRKNTSKAKTHKKRSHK